MEAADVVVVGAGVAGLACARELQSAGRRVVVVEARNVVGGRIQTLRRGDDVVELGAQVVHPTRGDLLRPALAAAGLRTVPLAPSDVFVVMRGRRAGAGQLAAARPPAPWVVEARLATLTELDATAAQAIEVLPEPSRQAAGAWVEQVVGGDPAVVHVAALAASRVDREDGGEARVEGGFDRLLAALAEGIDVRTTAPVTAVRRDDAGMTVDGAVPLRAQAVVLTVPPSVVVRGRIDVSPALSADRLRAAVRLASGDAVVVVLEVARAATSSAWVLLVDTPGGLWTTTAGSRLIVGHLKGRAAATGRALGWSPAEASEAARQVDPGLGAAVLGEHRDWGQDPYACGSYSLPVAGADEAAAVWAAPVGGQLFFAGEACAGAGERGLVQGALSSGRRAAREVLASALQA